MLGEALRLHGKELRFLWILCGKHLEAIFGHWMHDKNASSKSYSYYSSRDREDTRLVITFTIDWSWNIEKLTLVQWILERNCQVIGNGARFLSLSSRGWTRNCWRFRSGTEWGRGVGSGFALSSAVLCSQNPQLSGVSALHFDLCLQVKVASLKTMFSSMQSNM